MMNERSCSVGYKAGGYMPNNWSITFWFLIISTQQDDEMLLAWDIFGLTDSEERIQQDPVDSD